MEGESEVQLGEIADLIRGVSYRPPDLLKLGSESVPLLRATNIGNQTLELSDVLHVRSALVRDHQLLRRFDVVVAMSSGSREAVGRLAQLRRDWRGCVGAFCGVIRPIPERTDPAFLGYVLQSPNFRARIESVAEGTAIMNLSRERVLGFRLRLPTRPAQEAIAVILGALDDKIALNRRMSETLEAMARELFKSWFVDFDPVRAKAEGRDPGVSTNFAEVFPASMEDSEIGEIPSGWSACPLYEIASFVNGAAFATFRPNDERRGLPIIKIAELKAGITPQTRFSEVAMPEKYRISNGDILFSWSGNPDTSIDTFVWSGGPGWLNQHIFRVLPRHQHERAFVLSTLRAQRPVFAEIARNKQTTGLGHVTVEDMKRLLVVRPDTRVMKAWDAVVAPIHAKTLQGDLENRRLAALRDTLLPKLISGELRIPDAERIVGAVA